MKTLLAIVLATVLAMPAMAVETKQVCKEVKGKQVCKTIKVHKKFEGTKVPEKAPAKKK